MKKNFYLFTLMTALFMLPVPSLWAQYSGDIDNIKWSWEDEVLTLEGSGAMPNYSYSNPSPFEFPIQKVVIKDGITTVGDYIFANLTKLTSVEIPNTVTSIGECAFMETGLTSVTLTNSVTDIKWGAFYNCESLTSISLPNSVKNIETYAFFRCIGLKNVAIPSSVTSLACDAFSACTGLENLTVASENSTYDSRNNCNAIIETSTNTLIVGCKNTSIPNSVTSIGNNAFNSVGLTSVTIPASVTSIGDGAFASCTELQKLELQAETPPTCGEDVFDGVSNCVLSVPGSSIETYKTTAPWSAFSSIEALSGGSSSGNLGENITWTLDEQGVLTLEGTGAMPDYEYMSPAPWKDLSVKTAVIGEGITTIGNLMFYENSELTSVTIPGSVTTINQLAFYGCEGLTSVTIPNSVTSIGDAAFCNCTGLKSLFIPSSVTSIGSDAFTRCLGLESITVDSKNTTYDSRRGCNAIIETSTNTLIVGCKNTYIPSNVTSIGGSAFYNVGLTSVTIPASVTSIGDRAFAYCTELQKIEFYGGNAPTLGDDVFEEVDMSNCTLYATDYTTYMVNKQFQNFTNTEMLYSWTNSGTCGDGVNWMLHAQGVLEIEGTGAMNDFEDLTFNERPWKYLSYTKVAIGEGVTTIGNNAFKDNAELTSVTIPNSVTSIGDLAFRCCEGLTSVDIPSFVTSIGSYSFYLCEALPSVTIPSTVTNIGGMAFYDCWGLRKIESLAETPPTCGDDAFGGVSPDVCVLYVPKKSVEAYKTANEWKKLTKIEALPAKVVATGDCGDNLTWTLDADGLLTIEGIGAMYDYSNSESGTPWKDLSYTSVVIGDGVTTIGSGAFSYNTGLTSVTIANSVTDIRGEAFYECSGLTSITIPSSVTNIGMCAFNGCTGLEKIEALPVTPPACDTDAFYNVDINKCVLSVPEASVEKYKDADGWKEFYNGITGIDGVAEESNVAVSASNGVITVTGVADNTVVEVYSISGTLVYRGTSNTVAVPSAGIYVVKAAGKTVKVNAAR